jgi:hypothetical protein
MSGSEFTSAEVRESIFIAAHDELSRWGIDRFSAIAMADRHGLSMETIRLYWADDESLVRDVILRWPKRHIEIPDTGSLRTDLVELATAMARYTASEPGRSLLSAHLIKNQDQFSLGPRQAAWRFGVGALGDVFDRARERGEVSSDVDDRTAFELLFAPINMRVLFTGEVIDEQYCQTLAEWVWRAATSTRDVE